MASRLLKYRKSEVDPAESEDEEKSRPRSPLKGSKDDKASIGDYIPLQNNYSSMGDTPRPQSPPPDDDDDDGSQYSEDKSGTGKSTLSDDPSIDIPLHQAAREGDKVRLKKVVEELQKIYTDNPEKFDFELHKLNEQGYNALHLAARYNRRNCVAYLLDSGTNINLEDGEDGNTPLLLATKYNMTSSAKLLLERNADARKQNTYGTSALHFAARRGNLALCRLLLAIPHVDVNDKDNAGQTPLHMAMLGGSKEVTKLLIDKGADVFVVDIEGEGPIHFAAGEDNSDLICTLTYGAIKGLSSEEREPRQRRFVNLASNEGDRALHVAAQAGYEKSVRTLVTIGADVNVVTDTKDTPLHMAAISGQMEVVKYLILNRARISARDEDQMTPLHRACQYGRLEVVKFLILRKANIDAKDKDGYTPLMCAVWKGQINVVEYLIQKGAKIFLMDSAGKTVLHIAAEENRVDTLELLLLRKEAINLINSLDKENKSALHYCAIRGNQRALKLLIKNGAENDLVDREEMNPIHYAAKFGHLECVNSLMKNSAAGIIHCTDKKGRAPLHLAAIGGHIEVCAALIDKGAETSGRDDISWTPLDYAAQHGHYKTMQVLIDNDAIVDAVDKNNASPLLHAARNGTVEAVKMLLDNHATISLRNKDGKNCLDIAAENQNIDACYSLIAHPRWMEALQYIEKDSKRRRKTSVDSQTSGSNERNNQYPLEKLIELAPDVASAVLDKCIEKSNLPTTDKDYSITYNFELLDKLPPKGVGTKYFAPSTMVQYKRQNLLAHPLVVKLVRHKWSKLGQGLYYANLAVYSLFVILLTTIILREKRVQKDNRKLGLPFDCRSSKFTEVIPWLTIIFACMQIFKEFIQVLYLGTRYLKDLSNCLEFLLYLSTILFMMPFLLCQTGTENTSTMEHLKWNAAAIAILVGWINFLMYLKHIPFFGLHVTMFEEVLKSLLNVFIVFFILVVAFALSFFSLANVQAGFQDPGLSFVHTMVMMIGELDYDAMFTENFVHDSKQNLPHKGMSIFVFLVFVILMTIVLMNLLVGLAVGDIESVRKSAFLRILKAEVKTLQIFERSCPKFILRRIHAKKLVEYPNRWGFFSRLRNWLQNFDHQSLIAEQEQKGGMEETLREEIETQRTDIGKQKRKIKDLLGMLEEQLDKNRKLARKLGILDS